MLNTNANHTWLTWQQRVVAYVPYIIAVMLLIILPIFLPSYFQGMITKVLVFSIFTLALNLAFGYTGLFSLAHSAFFGIGGYAAGMLIVKIGIGSFWVSILGGFLAATLAAAVFGVIALRVSGLYFLLVTLAISQLCYSVAIKWRGVTGGSNGFTGFGWPDLGIPGLSINTTSYYYLVFIIFAAVLFLLYRIINSPFGHALQGIREDERRMQALGYNTWLYKYMSFVISGGLAGIGGVLFGYYSGIIAPTHLGVLTATLAMLMVIIGGDRILWGPVLGAAVVVLLEHFSSIYFPERWPLILGGVFVLCVMFLRGGISIYLIKLWKRVT